MIPILRKFESGPIGPVVYFVVSCDQLVYVGQSENLAARVGDHDKRTRWRRIDDVWYLRAPHDNRYRRDLESAFITKFNPPWNGLPGSCHQSPNATITRWTGEEIETFNDLRSCVY